MSAGHAADRAARHAKIRADIERYGVSYTVVSGGPLPRYAYSIGLLESAGYELILAGASFFNIERVYQAMDSARRAVVEGAAESVSVVDVGDFTLSPVQDAGARLIALGAFDYYANGQVRFLQLIPAMAHSTIDVPDMSEAPNWAREPVWRWLEMPWEYPVPPDSIVATNLAALRGEAVTELTRWAEGEWEMFAGPGPDVAAADMRVVPLGTLVGYDPSLSVAWQARIGEGYWRTDSSSGWHEWRSRTQASDASHN